ncbi:hypothetical protein BST61_g9023 [Cercospora zeina]
MTATERARHGTAAQHSASHRPRALGGSARPPSRSHRPHQESSLMFGRQFRLRLRPSAAPALQPVGATRCAFSPLSCAICVQTTQPAGKTPARTTTTDLSDAAHWLPTRSRRVPPIVPARSD